MPDLERRIGSSVFEEPFVVKSIRGPA